MSTPQTSDRSSTTTRPALSRSLLRCLWDAPGRDTPADEAAAADPRIAVPCVVLLAVLIGVKLVILLMLGVPGQSFFYQGF